MTGKLLTVANGLTTFRILLVFVVAFILYYDSLTAQIWALFLTVFIVLLDWLDGLVARYFKEETKVGSLYDIVGDRIVENVLWIVFAARGFVPVFVPLVFVTRSFIVDFIRALAFKKGKTAFGEATMIKSSFGRFISASRFMRGLYGILKSVVFAFVILAVNLDKILPALNLSQYAWLVPVCYRVSYVLVIATTVLCIIRALPTIIEAKKFIESAK